MLIFHCISVQFFLLSACTTAIVWVLKLLKLRHFNGYLKFAFYLQYFVLWCLGIFYSIYLVVDYLLSELVNETSFSELYDSTNFSKIYFHIFLLMFLIMWSQIENTYLFLTVLFTWLVSLKDHIDKMNNRTSSS